MNEGWQLCLECNGQGCQYCLGKGWYKDITCPHCGSRGGNGCELCACRNCGGEGCELCGLRRSSVWGGLARLAGFKGDTPTCPHCAGHGCAHCDDTGRLVDDQPDEPGP